MNNSRVVTQTIHTYNELHISFKTQPHLGKCTLYRLKICGWSWLILVTGFSNKEFTTCSWTNQSNWRLIAPITMRGCVKPNENHDINCHVKTTGCIHAVQINTNKKYLTKIISFGYLPKYNDILPKRNLHKTLCNRVLQNLPALVKIIGPYSGGSKPQ